MPRTAVKKSRERSVGPDEQSAAGTAELHNCVNLDEVLSSAVKLACDILKSDNASIALADEDGFLSFRTQVGVPPRFASRWRKRSSEGLSGIVFRTGQPYIAPDLRAEKHYVGKGLAQGWLRALLVVPLKVGDKVVGCLYVGYRNRRDFSPQEVRLASLFADHVSMFVESTTLLEQERRQLELSEALLEVVSAPSLSLNLRQVLVRLCQSVLKLTIGERCSIFLFNEETHTLDPIISLMSQGVEDPVLWEEMRASAGLKIPEIRGIGEAIEAHEPIVVEDAPGSGVIPSFWVETFGIKSAALYPLVHREKTVGVVVVDSFNKFVHFPAEEIETLAAVAKQAAVIIENAHLYEQERQQRQRAEALVNVLTATASTLSMKKVLIQLCEAVVNISVGERCSIFLLDSERGRLEPVMSLGARDEKLWQKFRRPPARVRREPGEQRFLQAATTWEKPIVVEDAENSPILPRWWVETFSLKSLVQYPLRVKDRTIGAMTVHTSSDRVRFPQEEVDTLAAVAKQAAVIIENARLYEQEQQQRQRAEALVNVLSAAASDMSFRKVLATISQSVLDFSVGERCSIFLFNEETHTLDPVMAVGPGDAGLYEKFHAAAGVPIPEFKGVGEAIQARHPIVEENAPAAKMLPLFWMEEFNIKSVVVYPLVHREKTVGILVVNTFSDFTHFPQEEVETLAAVAKQAAIIIENARLHERLKEQAITDPVTGLYNHRHIHQRLDEEFARACRSSQPLAVLMMDMDNFKFFNDTRGHLVGDEALRHAAGVFRKTLRVSDIIGRYGGDEFLAILPETSRDEAERVGQRIVSLLAEHPFWLTDSGQQEPLEVSIGVACYPDDTTVSLELVALADAALYNAKRMGGAQVIPAGADSTAPVSSASLGFGFLHSLLNALAHKDPYTRRHCEDNVRYVDRLADQLHLSAEAKESLRKAALLHDVGKIAIPDSTLLKPGPLDNGEWEVMRQHVQFGETIVRGIAQISDAIEPVATHHERYDGMGYPRGLKGNKIPLLGRILAVVDAYSAMTLDRPYRKALSHEEAKEELRKGTGTQFDPAVVKGFLAVIAVIEAEEQARRKAA
jgi:diguanylate cyclase (GGDEF)-like protein